MASSLLLNSSSLKRIGFKSFQRQMFTSLSTIPSPLTHQSFSLTPPQRTYSSTTPCSDKNNDDQNNSTINTPLPPNNRTYKLLYHRSPSRLKNPRFMLSFSTLNLTYWTWYVVDFAPAINSSARSKFDLGQIDLETLDLLTIDPTMGYVGLGVSVLIWGASVSYVGNLVSGIWKAVDNVDGSASGLGDRSTNDTKDMSLAVSTLKFPFVSLPEILNRVKYDPNANQFDEVENVTFTESELKADSNIKFYASGELAVMNDADVNGILVKLDGEMSRKRGHLALHKVEAGTMTTGDEPLLAHLTKQGYLLDIDEFEVVPGADPDLLRAFVLREDLVKRTRKQGKKRGMSNDVNDEGEENSDEDNSQETEEKINAKVNNMGESIARKKRLAMGMKVNGKKKR